MKRVLFLLSTLFLLPLYTASSAQSLPATQQKEHSVTPYFFPAEDQPHEGTWLIWPHQYTYGIEYREEIEGIWVQMTQALHTGERVHIIAYNEVEQKRITALLLAAHVDMGRVDFVIAKSDDVWVRDTGPLFVFDAQKRLTIVDFAFDGWGGKTPSHNDNAIPQAVAAAKNLPFVAIPDFVLEGGAIEMDGAGTLLATKSAVVSQSRNPHLTVAEAEAYLRRYLGVSHFIWLGGVSGEDITDAHIDGMARFIDSKTILTVSEEDFFELYEGILEEDYTTLQSATNALGTPYRIVELPMTAKNVKGLDYKGSYLNFYVGNAVVLVPVYDDTNDARALKILAELYVGRTVIPIDVRTLYKHGGMIHCVTQQQPR